MIRVSARDRDCPSKIPQSGQMLSPILSTRSRLLTKRPLFAESPLKSTYPWASPTFGVTRPAIAVYLNRTWLISRWKESCAVLIDSLFVLRLFILFGHFQGRPPMGISPRGQQQPYVRMFDLNFNLVTPTNSWTISEKSLLSAEYWLSLFIDWW